MLHQNQTCHKSGGVAWCAVSPSYCQKTGDLGTFQRDVGVVMSILEIGPLRRLSRHRRLPDDPLLFLRRIARDKTMGGLMPTRM